VLARYKVPQNIDMEDKIIGPLTMIQFVYLLVGGMAVYLMWTFFDISLFLITGIPILILTLAMAFLKVQDQPFPKFLASAILFLVKPKARVWAKDPNASHLSIVKKTASKPEEASPTQQGPSRGEIAQLASVLDTGGRAKAFEDRTVAPEPQQTQPPQTPVTQVPPNSPTQPPAPTATKTVPIQQATPAPQPAPPQVPPKPQTPTESLKKIADVASQPAGSVPMAGTGAGSIPTEPPKPPDNTAAQLAGALDMQPIEQQTDENGQT